MMNVQANNRVTDKSFNAAVQAIADEGKDTKGTPAKTLPFLKQGELPMVISRTDILGKNYVFFPQSEDRASDTVVYWDGNKEGTLQTAPTAYYHNMKRADEGVGRKLAQQFSATFGYKELVMRTRLIKEGTLKRDEEGTVDAKGIAEWKRNLINAITKTILEA